MAFEPVRHCRGPRIASHRKSLSQIGRSEGGRCLGTPTHAAVR
jgi:hypothetical protein